ncbi:MAG: efflux RND transporter periplasmic adaptor subunit, partial [Ruminiclostridium sp.]
MHKGIKKVKWNKKKFIALSIVSLVIIFIVIGSVVITRNNASKSTLASVQRTVSVTKGNIEVNLSGSGTVASASASDLMSNVQGKITKSYSKQGAAVKQGDLLYEIDDT